MARIVDNTNQLAAPRWAGDFGSPELGLMRGGLRLDPAQFTSTVYTITVTEPATAGDAALTVAALPVALPAGTFLQSGTNEIIRIATNAALGATALVVDAIGQALEDNDVFLYTVVHASPVVVPDGTPVGRTLAERNSGDGFGPAAAADDEIYLIYFPVQDVVINPDFVGYRPDAGRIVKENFLPSGWDTISGVVTKLRAKYTLIRGAA